MRANASSIQDVLKDMQFPAKKEQIIEQARKQNVPSEIIENLQQLPDQTYESAESVMSPLQKGAGGVTKGVSESVGSILGGVGGITKGVSESVGSLQKGTGDVTKGVSESTESLQKGVSDMTKGASESTSFVLEGDVLKGIKFPVGKEQILQYVRGQNAPTDVINDLQRLPEREYKSADDVMRELESTSRQTGGGGGGKSQGFGGTGTGGSGGGGPSTGGSSQSFGGRGGT